LSDYYDTYLSSDSNVLILLGPPGTGKTSFLRGLLHHAQSDALISYDPDILRDDEIFADFMSGQERFMILEDADTFLASRTKSGNTVMHKFLNVGDGLLSTKGKKIVFTTNLPSIRDIDDALMRPGRCFDVLRFGKLTPEEAKVVRPDYSGTESISLAELLNGGPNPATRKDSVGFV
jgi:SpoVK/Ycf46/Vps4 family AAA+-type ATPase